MRSMTPEKAQNRRAADSGVAHPFGRPDPGRETVAEQA
jgi:hypothetical protein